MGLSFSIIKEGRKGGREVRKKKGRKEERKGKGMLTSVNTGKCGGVGSSL